MNGSIHSELAKAIISDRHAAARRRALSTRAVREARAAARDDQASGPRPRAAVVSWVRALLGAPAA